MKFFSRFLLQGLLAGVFLVVSPLSMAKQADTTAVDQQMILHLLNYIGGDYRLAVADGMVLNWDEFAEQQEFSNELIHKMKRLPDLPQKAALDRQLNKLIVLIDRKSSPDEVAFLCKDISLNLIEAYDIVIAPQLIPTLSQVKEHYMDSCAICHGDQGLGNGAVASRYNPTPTNFADLKWQAPRSLYAIYNTISLGVNGTAMRGFDEYTEQQRWALAFYVSSFADSYEQRYTGSALWEKSDQKLFPNIAALTNTSVDEVREHYGKDGVAMYAYLRTNPHALNMEAATPKGTLLFSIKTLGQSQASYAAGDLEQARQYAISAYLEGFELVENGLSLVDGELTVEIEREMSKFRSLVKTSLNDDKVSAQFDLLKDLLHHADELMHSTSLSPMMVFFSALIILLREGVEAILVLVAIGTFLIKTERRDGLFYLHAGWITALLAGGVTWYVAAYVVSISGASRELTEGIAALVAAVMLLYVGYWLHSLANTRKWQAFIHEKVNAVLGKGTLWGIAFISFLAVYREAFETVLFYQALWLQSGEAGHSNLLAGMLVGAISLFFIGWLILKFSKRLPLRLFFNVNALLLFVLAVIFSGKGISAMQEAGIFTLTMVDFPRVDVLGIYPSQEGLLTQGIIVFSGIFWVLYQRFTDK